MADEPEKNCERSAVGFSSMRTCDSYIHTYGQTMVMNGLAIKAYIVAHDDRPAGLLKYSLPQSLDIIFKVEMCFLIGRPQ